MKKSLLIVLTLLVSTSIYAQRISDHTITVIDRSMADELERSRTQLKLGGLVDPFFISYTVSDNNRLDIIASFGALTRSSYTHQRQLNLRLLINNYQLNDENFSDGGGGIFGGGNQIDMSLPLDDDYNTIRRAFWLATDDLFKDANETFTKKKAALDRKQLTDEDKNLPDFAMAPKVESIEAPIDVQIDKAKLESLVRDISAVFEKYKPIQNSNVSLSINNTYEFVKNTEGTNIRKPKTNCDITVQASAQAIDDGEPLSLAFSLSAPTSDGLPDRKQLLERTEKLARDLVALTTAPKFEDKEYTGPVLFEDDAASEFLSEQIVSKLSAQREDILGGGSVFSLISKGPTFQKKIGTRVLPVSMSVRDLPLAKPKSHVPYLGNYSVDDEGVVPSDLTLVDNGILKTLYMTRTPTKEVKEPNGHSRPQGSGVGTGTIAGPGVVVITNKKSIEVDEMKKELLKRAKEDGYDFAFIVRSTQKGSLLFSEGMSNIGDVLESGKSLSPALLYKVSKDGKESLIRGVEISFPTARDLREIITSKEQVTKDMGLAAGAGGGFFGFGGKVPATLIGPASILVPELEARKKKTSANPTQPVVDKP